MSKKTVFAEIVEAVGFKIAKEMCDCFGGAVIYIPQSKKVRERNPRFAQLSEEARLALDTFARETIYLPLNPMSDRGETFRLVVELRQKRHAITDIARMVECTERNVYICLKKAREQGISLPDTCHHKSDNNSPASNGGLTHSEVQAS